jgi:hypothetical protein
MWLGVAFLVFVVVAGALIGYFVYVGSSLDASSKAFVDASVPSIVSTWSREELLTRAAPELLKVVNDEQLDLLFAKLSRLGRLQSYEGSRGDSHISFTTWAGRVVTASYVASATFDKGPAQVTIRLIEHDGRWQILHFQVYSPIFLQRNPASQASETLAGRGDLRARTSARATPAAAPPSAGRRPPSG